MARRAVQGFVAGDTEFEKQPDLTSARRAALEQLLSTNRSDDEQERLEGLRAAIEGGQLPGLKEVLPVYVPKGKGSWKHLATGVEAEGDEGITPIWSSAFEDSDYRKFHDATKEHRFFVTQEVLPRIGLRLA